MSGLAAHAQSRAAAMRHSSVTAGAGVTRYGLAAREKSDLGSSASRYGGRARVNEAAPRGPQDRLGSLSRAISIDSPYSEGQWREVPV